MRMLTLLSLLQACSDYNFKSTVDDQPAGEDTDVGIPDVAADPAALDLGTVCAAGASEVAVLSQGDAPLTVISVSVLGSGWSLGDVTVPVELAPGERLVVPVLTSGGEATLLVETDDSDTPELSVPLAAGLDAAPPVSIDSPLDGEVLSPSTVSTFQASVGDDVDAPESLSLSWSSDVSGTLSTAPADSAGLASLGWDASALASGAHTVTLTATDACGNTAVDSVTICQNEGYIEDSVDLESWHFEGTALWDSANGWVQLTEPVTDQAGTAFQTSATVDADNVVIAFSFYVSGGTGADGMSLTALDTTRMSSFVGASGGGIGYGGLPGWSVEVDTWHNGEYYEPTAEDHLSIVLDGNAASPVVSAALPEMEDNLWHTMSVTVIEGWMTVSVDDVVYIDQLVTGLTSFPAYVGFTGATGAVTNYHLVDALAVERFVCEE